VTLLKNGKTRGVGWAVVFVSFVTTKKRLRFFFKKN
jgi:hypothetical protein